MPISATGNNVVRPGGGRRSLARVGAGSPKRDSGFTLIELMVVLLIVGLAAGAVILSLPDSRGRLSDEAERFAARTVAARDLAILEGRPIAVRVTARGYAFDRRQGGIWLPLSDKSFASRPWAEGTSALVGQGRTIRAAFDATGQPSMPATILLTRSGEKVRVSIAADGGVRVEA